MSFLDLAKKRCSTRAYQPIPDLTGYTAKVYQLSDAVGRGYPGTRTL